MHFPSKPSFTDEEILQGLMQGPAQRERFVGILFKRYRGFIFKGAKEFGISRDTALDAYSDAVISVTRHIEQGNFRGESSLSTYLYTAFRNRCRDLLRRAGQEPQTLAWIDEIPHLPEQARDALRQLVDQEEFEHILSKLEELGETCREILLLSEYHGYSMDEIAARIGYENGHSVSSKKYRCLEKLRKMLGRE